MMRSKLGFLGNLEEYFFRGFSTPSFPFCTVPKTKNSETQTSEFFLRHFDQTLRYFDQAPRFSNSEFSILLYTQNGNFEDENPEFSLRPFDQYLRFSIS